MKFPASSVIGIGGLGTALTKALLAGGIPVKSIFNRTANKAEALAASTGIQKWGEFPFSLDELGSLIFVTVPDSSIKAVAGKLAQLEDEAVFKGRTVVHCSGSESADLLSQLESKGAAVASFHPLQTFNDKSHPDSFQGIYFSIQGDPQTFPLLQNIARQLGGHTLQVTPKQKSQLHTAAVISSNYLNTLLQASVEIGAMGGLSPSKVKEALLPLVETTLENTSKFPFEEALTGPIKRGDIETIEKHLALLRDQIELRELYCTLGLQTLNMAESSGKLNNSAVEKMRKLLHQQKPMSS